MTIAAKLIEDSITHEGLRCSTFLLTYPRIVHSEMLRHRPISHSVSSSRAVPVMRMLRNVIADPAEPVEWGSNKPGMQAGAELTGLRRWIVRRMWHTAKWGALGAAYIAAKAGAHKQIANRIIEPWTHTTEVVTATDLASFFELRLHDAADPTIRAVAEAMRVEMVKSIPALLEPGEWHLPLVGRHERMNFHTSVLRNISAARCARASYMNHDQSDPVISRDLELATTLRTSKHWSPFEHQATPDQVNEAGEDWTTPGLHGNLTGFNQNRKILELGAPL